MTAAATTADEPAVARTGSARAAGVAAVALGVGWGVATSALQTVLPAPFGALANAVAPWLMAPFVVGRLSPGPRTAAAFGLLACLLQVLAYYVTSDLRGFAVGGAFVLVWSAAAAVGGPVFGLAGRLHGHARGRLRGAPPALVAGVWAAEGVATYAIVLEYTGEAVLFCVVGLVLFVALARGGRLLPALAWLAVVLPLGIGGFLLLQTVLGGGLPAGR